MIKIVKLPCPAELTEEKKKSFTRNYIISKTPVWNKCYIKRDLLASSNNKCAYCECMLSIESKYVEVEHFHDKDTYPNQVVEWENLLPSCKRCNGNKGTFDTRVNPFINPATMNPKKHLVLNTFRFFHKTDAAKNTIDNLVLNDSSRLVSVRSDIGNAVGVRIHEIYSITKNYFERSTTDNATENEINSQLRNLMREALPTAEYSATVSTVLINNYDFINLHKMLRDAGLWDDELQDKLMTIKNIALDTSLPTHLP